MLSSVHYAYAAVLVSSLLFTPFPPRTDPLCTCHKASSHHKCALKIQENSHLVLPAALVRTVFKHGLADRLRSEVGVPTSLTDTSS